MRRAFDSALEAALHLVFAPPQPDATERVLARWRAGDVGDRSALEERPLPRLQRWPIVAGVVAACAVALLLVTTARGRSEPFARSARPLRVLGDREAARFAAGDTLAVAAAAELELADGTHVSLAPESVLSLAERERAPWLVPRRGSLRIERIDGGSLYLATPLGTVEIGRDACLELELGAAPPFTHFLEEIPMNPLVLTASLTLLSGSARLIDGDQTGPLQAGEVRHAVPASDPHVELLFAEVGTWDLELTDHLPDGSQLSFRGTETCSVGPGRQWLLCDTAFTRREMAITIHFVVGYSPHHGRYFGSLVDNFGGGMELFDGAPGADPRSRALESRLLGGEDEDLTRYTMTWVTDDERRTTLESQRGDEWILIREIRHRRRR